MKVENCTMFPLTKRGLRVNIINVTKQDILQLSVGAKMWIAGSVGKRDTCMQKQGNKQKSKTGQ